MRFCRSNEKDLTIDVFDAKNSDEVFQRIVGVLTQYIGDDCSPPGGGHFPSGVQNVNLGLSRVRTRAILNRHEATLYGGGHALYNAVQTEFPFYAFFVAVHGVQGNFQGRCNL